jgi:hypothetical protein
MNASVHHPIIGKKSKEISSDTGSEFVGSKCKGTSCLVHPQEEGKPIVLCVLKLDTLVTDQLLQDHLCSFMCGQPRRTNIYQISAFHI